ncbi:MAG: hypothetical protein U0174_15800 [Polyangiaceae bacterium]
MNNNKKNDLSLNLRRVRKSLRTDVNTGGAGGSRTQCGGTMCLSYTNGDSYTPDQN